MKTIELNYTPSVAVEYVRNWIAVLDKSKNATIEQKAIVADLLTLAMLAEKVLAPQEKKTNETKKQVSWRRNLNLKRSYAIALKLIASTS